LLLGQQGSDWEGGEFVLVEQRPRAQSKAQVVLADCGQAIIFTTAGERYSRILPGQSATWSEPRASRNALHPGHHFSRRKMSRGIFQ
jgi:hypothetical protein